MQLSLDLATSPLETLRDGLLKTFGPQRPTKRLDPVSQLVRSMIGGRSPDAASWAAYHRLRDRFATWEDLVEAPEGVVLELIKDVTYPEEKARHLPHALRLIQVRSGWKLSLDHLSELELDSARWWLQGLPGVGVKVAASVLNFSPLNMRALVIDTHVHRVASRYGLIPASYDTAHAYRALMDLVPDRWTPEDLYELHWLMKGLGQLLCAQHAPRCGACALNGGCARAGVARSADILAWKPRR
ncbi:endonuclease III domain-containing protein [Caulobacter sp. DWR2-3-1b2]|uniref:endonuclease III domain-containing protein n=1 Tax=unclassified Caulobacter TaxID=2648921 RepID=UPI003CF8F553